MEATKDILNVHTLVALGEIVRAAQQCAKIAYVLPDGDVMYGTARALSHPGGGFLSSDDDVRDGCLWVTTAAGFEIWPTVRELLASEQFSIYDW